MISCQDGNALRRVIYLKSRGDHVTSLDEQVTTCFGSGLTSAELEYEHLQ